MLKNQKKRVTCACVICGNNFISSWKTAKFCSDECRKKDRHKRNSLQPKNRVSSDTYIRNLICRASKTPVDVEYVRNLKYTQKKCFYCGIELNYSNFSIDHKIPVVKGGTNCNENLVACCLYCNSRKKTKTAEEYLEELKVYGIIDHWAKDQTKKDIPY